MMEEALVAWLSAAGTSAEGRITWLERDRAGGLPAATLQMISPNQGGAAGRYHHQGEHNLHYPRIQVDCWGGSPITAKILARELTDLLEDEHTQGTVAFEGGLLDSASDEPPETLEGGRKIYRTRLDFLVPWREV